LRKDLRNGVRKIEPLPVGAEPERFNFGDAANALF
jgi:hypothetical protein